MIPLFITNRDRLTPLPALIAAAQTLTDTQPTIIDNNSTYEPLLDYYKKHCPIPVIRTDVNLGPRSPWDYGDLLPKSGYYMVTDGDLVLQCQPHTPQLFKLGLEKYSHVCKVGLNEIYDGMNPNHPLYAHAKRQTDAFWKERQDEEFWIGDIDTTLAMYRAGQPPCTYGPALRTDRPHTCSQACWYYDPQNLPEDEIYYLTHLDETYTPGTTWTPRLQKLLTCGK